MKFSFKRRLFLQLGATASILGTATTLHAQIWQWGFFRGGVADGPAPSFTCVVMAAPACSVPVSGNT